MNTYKAKSQKYQIFVSYVKPGINILNINIPKLNLNLDYSFSEKMYKKTFYMRSKYEILKSIAIRIEKNLKPIYYEINHFVIENKLIDLLKSNDELNQKLGSEILLLKLKNIKL
jgi:hypothetical protein